MEPIWEDDIVRIEDDYCEKLVDSSILQINHFIIQLAKWKSSINTRVVDTVLIWRILPKKRAGTVHGFSVPLGQWSNRSPVSWTALENQKFIPHYGDMTDSTTLNLVWSGSWRSMRFIISQRHESHVKCLFEMPEYTGNADGLGLRILEATACWGLWKENPNLSASTSELYGKFRKSRK
jgi:GDP-D-mannose dehydratase